MIHQSMSATSAVRLSGLTLSLATALSLFGSTGCRSNLPIVPQSSRPATVVGTLVDIKDGRSWDGGIDLTLETAIGASELARVPSVYRRPPREWVIAMHKVVDASKLGDRLRARGKRDPSGALNVETLENISTK